MAALSNYLENALMNAVLNNTSYTSPTTTFVGLFTSDPTDAGSGTEVSGGSYARQAASFGAASEGNCTNDADITFPQATGNWGTVTHFGLYDASTSGNLLFHGALTSSKVIETGDIFKIASTNLSITLA
jgi:hypothetical protein